MLATTRQISWPKREQNFGGKDAALMDSLMQNKLFFMVEKLLNKHLLFLLRFYDTVR